MRERVQLPADLPALPQLGIRADFHDARLRGEPAGHADRLCALFGGTPRGEIWTPFAWCAAIPAGWLWFPCSRVAIRDDGIRHGRAANSTQTTGIAHIVSSALRRSGRCPRWGPSPTGAHLPTGEPPGTRSVPLRAEHAQQPRRSKHAPPPVTASPDVGELHRRGGHRCSGSRLSGSRRDDGRCLLLLIREGAHDDLLRARGRSWPPRRRTKPLRHHRFRRRPAAQHPALALRLGHGVAAGVEQTGRRLRHHPSARTHRMRHRPAPTRSRRPYRRGPDPSPCRR